MTSIKITCITLKAGRSGHEHITHIGGPAGGGWRLLTAQAVSTVERGVNAYYMLDEDGTRLELALVQGPRRKHLQARRSGEWSDALLALPACGQPFS